MTNPQYKLGSLTHSLYRDLLTDETIIKNNNIDVLKISGTTNEDALLVAKENPVIRVLSTNTGTTSSASLTMGIEGGDFWDISTGISGETINTDLDLFINKNGTNKLTILDDGNVGIGTTSPSQKLEVVGDATIGSSGEEARIGNVGHNDWAGFAAANFATSGGYCLIQNNSSGAVYLNRPSGQSIGFRRNNTDDMIINSSGNVGIGTNPSYKLDVNGSINSASYVRASVSNTVGALGRILCGYGNNVQLNASSVITIATGLDGTNQHMYAIEIMGNTRITTSNNAIVLRYNSVSTGYGIILRNELTNTQLIGSGSYSGWAIMMLDTTSRTHGSNDYCAWNGTYLLSQNNNMTIPSGGGTTQAINFKGNTSSLNSFDFHHSTTGCHFSSAKISSLQLYAGTNVNSYITYRVYRLT